jgi:AcrR family transcriptional regulator
MVIHPAPSGLHTDPSAPAAPAAPRSGPDRRGQVLDAARRLWGRKGYHAVSLRGIASEAGVSLALLDHHFGHKHLLFAEAVRPLAESCERARLRLQQAPPAGDAAWASRLALALLEPAWDIHRGAAGCDPLRLWLQHRYDRMPEIRLPLDRATLPLIRTVAEAMPDDQAAQPLWQRIKTCRMVFADGMEWLVGDLLPDMADPSDTEPTAALSFENLRKRMALTLALDSSDTQPA